MAESHRKLPENAHRPLAPGETYHPYVPATESPAEFTIKALLFGILFGILAGHIRIKRMKYKRAYTSFLSAGEQLIDAPASSP